MNYNYYVSNIIDSLSEVDSNYYSPSREVIVENEGVWHENCEEKKNVINRAINRAFIRLRDFNDDDEDDDEDNANLCAENNIAECLMTHKKDEWNKIRGGKYTRFDAEYKYPDTNYIKDLPLCKCCLPCDIRKNEDKNYLYFRCAKKNMWDNLREKFNIDDEPCNFFMEYIKDKQLKIQENNRVEERRKILKELFKKSCWLKNIEINDRNYPNQCVGGCNRTSESIKLTYSNEKRNLCFDCFIAGGRCKCKNKNNKQGSK
jgi:hypothetical protein